MVINIQKIQLVAALERLQRIVLKRPKIPVLKNVLLEVKGNTLTLTATDSEIFLHTHIRS